MSLWHKILSGVASLSLNCREATRAQSDALDAPLPIMRRVGLRIHWLMCKWCRRYGEQIHFLRSSAHAHEEALTKAEPERLSEEARARIKEKLQRGP